MVLLKTQADYSLINNLLYKSYIPKLIQTAIHIRLFETLEKEPLELEIIAEKTQTKVNLTEALLEVFTALEWLARKNGKYELTLLTRNFLLPSSEIEQLAAIQSV
ncbi:MAG: hypothetical protein JEZ14_26225, partial [Marinilabiliaceae bacterium]|nr:hypothetical protein [Marinilabiliaceae bacterium]